MRHLDACSENYFRCAASVSPRRRYPLCWSREDHSNTGSFTMNFRSIFAASAALLLSSAAANAAQVAALIGGDTIVTIAMDGKATMKSKLDTMLAKGVAATVDFNPVADRLRVMGADGMNLRANVDDGKVTKDGDHKYAEGDMHKGEKPNIVAGAYTNSVKGAKETALYNIDATIGGLIKQAPPNDGTLNAIGKLGIKANNVAFDIWSDGAGKNAAWLMADGT